MTTTPNLRTAAENARFAHTGAENESARASARLAEATAAMTAMASEFRGAQDVITDYLVALHVRLHWTDAARRARNLRAARSHDDRSFLLEAVVDVRDHLLARLRNNTVGAVTAATAIGRGVQEAEGTAARIWLNATEYAAAALRELQAVERTDDIAPCVWLDPAEHAAAALRELPQE
jgi:hypothetical protein